MDTFKDYSNKRILYIDDSSANLMAGEAALVNYNINLDTGSNMAEMLQLVKEHEYDLIILDDMMPDNKISGTDAMKKLRLGGYNKPIIVLTANTSAADKKSYLNAGFDEYLPKPINISDLDKILHKFLD